VFPLADVVTVLSPLDTFNILERNLLSKKDKEDPLDEGAELYFLTAETTMGRRSTQPEYLE